jgi:transglutaminase-like putative cysteine protease
MIFIKHGGGKIKRRLFLSVLLLFSLALVFNINFSSAASVNQTNISTSAKSLDIVNVNISSSNHTTTTNAKATLNTVKKVTVKPAPKTNINSTMAAGALVKVNGLTVAQLKAGVSRVQAFYDKNGRLPNYVSYGTRHIAIATFQKNIATQGLKINTIKVNGLTVAQLKAGVSRVQAFYDKNGRLPNYVSYGTRHIAIATFQKNIATQGLKINTTTANSVAKTKPNTSSVSALAKSLKSSSTYKTAVKIFNWVRDNISYSFYYNTKYGAAGTLKHMTGNCCDTANILVALARDAGITARYVHGTCRFSSGTYGHVWAQLNINGKWTTADATSFRNSLGVIKNWNTKTYKLNGIYNKLPF